MLDFFKFYRSKLFEFFNLNYYYFLLFVCSEILSTILLSVSFLGVINYFAGNKIIIINFTILENPMHILILVCCAIFFTIVLKYINKVSILKLLNLLKTKDNYKLLPLNRVFVLSVVANFVTIILLLIILLISFFDFIFFITLNILFLIYPLLKKGKWITYINKLDTRLGDSTWRWTYDYQVVGKRDFSDLDDKDFVRLRRKKNKLVTIMYLIFLTIFVFFMSWLSKFLILVLN